MRTAALAVLMFGLLANPMLAATGVDKQTGGAKIVTLDIVNDAGDDLLVTINQGFNVLLPAGQTYTFSVDVGKGNSKSTVSLLASLVSAPTISVYGTATIQAGKTSTATITRPASSTLAITFSN